MSGKLTTAHLPVLGEKCVEDIEVSDIQRLFNEMDGAKTTKNKARIVLNMVLDFAVEDGIIAKTPPNPSASR